MPNLRPTQPLPITPATPLAELRELARAHPETDVRVEARRELVRRGELV